MIKLLVILWLELGGLICLCWWLWDGESSATVAKVLKVIDIVLAIPVIGFFGYFVFLMIALRGLGSQGGN